ncbi:MULTISPECIES: ROK family protein [Methanoculleus]|uniref:Glucokinase n=2 Tax=Methanoculleus TaxID=45989 RepID=A3CYF8_METMJ|nr:MULTISPECIES: ROK family protein [Methanoculleus]ABN58408.1 glucokinase [Methanoculleus marisnigri JR1]UYU17406.1 ROK family protein [Methanoculleus submarinus]
MTTVIAVDLGGTNLRAALVGSDATLLAHDAVPTPTAGASGEVITAAIAARVETLLASPQGREAAAIGVASAGPLDPARGWVVDSPNIAFPVVEIVEPLRERFGLPVALINDARAGVLGERWAGAARGSDNVVYITLSTGIGGGAVVNGRLLLGMSGNAGEIGHIPVDTRYNLVCGCGFAGHWEAYASAKNIPGFFAAWRDAADVRDAAFDPSSTRAIFTAARAEDPVALAFMEALGEMNARGVSSVIVAYNPEVIVFDGPLARYYGDIVIRQMEPFIDRYLALPRLVVSDLAGQAPLLGAAAYALEAR